MWLQSISLLSLPRTWTRLRSLTFIRLHLSIKHVFYLLCVLWILLKKVINAVLALVYIECLKHEDFNFHFSWLHVPHRGCVHLRRSFIIKEVLGPRLVLGHPSPRSLQGLSLSSDTKSSSSPRPRTPKSSSSPRPRTTQSSTTTLQSRLLFTSNTCKESTHTYEPIFAP